MHSIGGLRGSRKTATKFIEAVEKLEL